MIYIKQFYYAKKEVKLAIDLLQINSNGSAFLLDEETSEDLLVEVQEVEIPTGQCGIILPRTPLLSKEQEQDLFQQLEENPDGDSAREKIIESNLRLVLYVAWMRKRKLPASSILEVDDLFMEGYFGLLKAIKYFDWRRNAKFSTYAFLWINQKISRAIKNQDNVIRIPVYVHGMMKRYRNTEDVLNQELGRVPSLKEIAEKMELPVVRVEHIKQLLDMKIRFSLDKTDDDEDPESNSHLKLVSMKAGQKDNTDPVSKDFLNEAVLKAIDECKSLSPKERKIILMRFGLGEAKRPYTLQEIGDIFIVCRERVRQIEARALRKMKADPNFVNLAKNFY